MALSSRPQGDADFRALAQGLGTHTSSLTRVPILAWRPHQSCFGGPVHCPRLSVLGYYNVFAATSSKKFLEGGNSSLLFLEHLIWARLLGGTQKWRARCPRPLCHLGHFPLSHNTPRQGLEPPRCKPRGVWWQQDMEKPSRCAQGEAEVGALLT